MKKIYLVLAALIFSTSLFAVTVVKNRKILFDGIVTPDKPFPVVSFAAKELSYHFRRATGKALPIIKESAAKPGAKYFYLGSCKFNASLNSARLPWATGIIKINKDSIQIAGNDAYRQTEADFQRIPL